MQQAITSLLYQLAGLLGPLSPATKAIVPALLALVVALVIILLVVVLVWFLDHTHAFA